MTEDNEQQEPSRTSPRSLPALYPRHKAEVEAAEPIDLRSLSDEEREELIRKMVNQRYSRDGQVPYAVIAKTHGVSTYTARSLIQQAQRDLVSDDELRQLKGHHQSYYDRLLQSYWAKATSGDIEAAEFVVKVLDKIQNLHGFSKTNISITHHQGEDKRKQVESILDRLQASGQEIIDIPPTPE